MPALISRTQAWCKLAVLIADGLPAPIGVHFLQPEDDVVSIEVPADAFARWAAALGTVEGYRYDYDTGPNAGSIRNRVDIWCGYTVDLVAYVLRNADQPAPADVLAKVRAVAAGADDATPRPISPVLPRLDGP